MNFLTANIDRAIVMTQYDLRGFAHPLGFRFEDRSPKNLDAITGNFLGFAAGFGRGNTSEYTDKAYADYFTSSSRSYLAMCKRLKKDCDPSQVEAIQLIVLEIVKQNREMTAEVAAGTREVNGYLMPLKRSNHWGKVVLSLAKAFEVNLDPVTKA